MKALLKKVSAALLVVPAMVLSLGVGLPAAVHAQAAAPTGCDIVTTGGISHGAECAKPTNAPSSLFGPNSIFVTITNIMLFIIGAIAVIMLIIGGIRYVVSAGDQNAVTSAKNTILYAIIGIVVAFLAYAAVNFVSNQLTAGTTTTYVPTIHEA
jgi:multisubunit Na+/H+ antiporter MnhB subunit